MSQIFLISDTHFGHNAAYRFSDKHGNRMRAWADNAEEGDEIMVAAWNSVVGPRDKVYHLGDVAIPKNSNMIMDRLNGTKVLIRGNHDKQKLSLYSRYFKDVRGSHKIDRFIMTHYPILELPHWCFANIHGHIHEKNVMDKSLVGRLLKRRHPRYVNVSVEQLHNQAPIAFDMIRCSYCD